MPAIEPHKTATSDAAWDGPANEARLKSGESRAYYARAFAWRDPDRDDSTKSAYRFIHHFVSEDGEPGAASIVACRTGIAVLNGARGGTTIPASDRPGVYRHLAAHLRDAGIEPPALRSIAEEFCVRDARLKIKSLDESGSFTGFAATYGNKDAYGDIIAHGAFAKTLGDSRARPLLWAHDIRQPIGIVELRDDFRGLHVTGRLALGVQKANEAYELMKLGAVRGMSIGFVPRRWEATDDGNGRKFLEIELIEVSLTAFPANPKATVDLLKSDDIETDLLAAADGTAREAEPEAEPALVHSTDQDRIEYAVLCELIKRRLEWHRK